MLWKLPVEERSYFLGVAVPEMAKRVTEIESIIGAKVKQIIVALYAHWFPCRRLFYYENAGAVEKREQYFLHRIKHQRCCLWRSLVCPCKLVMIFVL